MRWEKGEGEGEKLGDGGRKICVWTLGVNKTEDVQTPLCVRIGSDTWKNCKKDPVLK